MGNGIFTPNSALMASIHARWEKTLSIERPIKAQSMAANSGAAAARAMNSLVQTGVKSAGWANRMAHWPRRSLSVSSPSVVRAEKSGALSPILGKGRNVGVAL